MNAIPDLSFDTVLIVEDDAVIRRMLEASLERTGGYTVLSSGDGVEGLRRAIEERPDVLILDLSLPGMNGLDLMEELNRRNLLIPTIIITAHADANHITRAFRLGAKNLLPKPFSVRDLQETLESVLSEARMARQAQELTASLAAANRSLQRKVGNWEVLNDIAQGMITLTDEREIYQQGVTHISRILDVEATSVLLLDEAGTHIAEELTVHSPERLPAAEAGADPASPAFRDVYVELQGTVAGHVVTEGAPLALTHAGTDPHFRASSSGTPLRAHANWYAADVGGARSVICVPLIVQERVIGVLEILNRMNGTVADIDHPDFAAEELDIVRVLASWITFAIQNVRLGESRQKLAAAQTLAQTVTTLAHHVNNPLMACFLELDRLRLASAPEAGRGGAAGAQPQLDSALLAETTDTIQSSLERIHEVIKALTELRDVRTVRDIDDQDMIDLDAVLGDR